MTSRSTSFHRNPLATRRPSISSRLSVAVSVEHGEAGASVAPAEALIEEEIAEIKRYEVCFMALQTGTWQTWGLTSVTGLYNNRYETGPDV